MSSEKEPTDNYKILVAWQGIKKEKTTFIKRFIINIKKIKKMFKKIMLLVLLTSVIISCEKDNSYSENEERVLTNIRYYLAEYVESNISHLSIEMICMKTTSTDQYAFVVFLGEKYYINYKLSDEKDYSRYQSAIIRDHNMDRTCWSIGNQK